MRSSRMVLPVALAAAMTGFVALGVPERAAAVDTPTPTTDFDLSSARTHIKAKNWPAALKELRELADKYQHADIYNLLGFSLRKSGDYTTALTFYKKALDFDPEHKSAHEYLGELYVETGNLAKAREHAAILARLCPQGCEERTDLDEAIAKATPKK